MIKGLHDNFLIINYEIRYKFVDLEHHLILKQTFLTD